MIVVESVGKEQDGETPVALRFILDKATYDSIPEATFKAPLKMSGTYISDPEKQLCSFRGNQIGPFENEIRKFQDLREKLTGENRVHDSELVSKVKLSQYASKQFAVTTASNDNERRAGWFFVGDAAMGVPFYRSINAGLTLAGKLGPILADPEKSAEIKTKLYEAQREPTLKREFNIVSKKMRGINFYKDNIRPILQGTKSVGKTAGKVAGIAGIGVAAVVILPIALVGIGAARMLGIEVRLM